MSNGDPWAKMWEISRDIATIKSNGCAHRDGDLERVERMERSNERLHKRIDALVMLLVANLVALVVSLIGRAPAIIKYLMETGTAP